MSKLKLDKINYDESDFIVEIIEKKEEQEKPIVSTKNEIQTHKEAQEIFLEAQKNVAESKLILNRAKAEAQEIIENAQKEVQETKNKIQKELEQLEAQKNEILKSANTQAAKIIEEAKENSSKEANELIEKSKEEIESERISTIKNAYDEGYKDGLEHIEDELNEKISIFETFCLNQYEIRDKILKSANKDILDLIINISKKILLKELNAEIIDKIIKNAISLLEKKENISIILSEKYAKLLFEYQKKSLTNEIEFNFEDFKQYENFDIVYNPGFDDDTIIVENLKERYDASINSQLDVIIRNIYDNTQNGKLDLENFENEAK
ncbi:MAG: hypothetical protein IKU37_07260 [Candidatus Gastranaerophilales bacterium]|nr:hypothetical protein [Candidatus Gastranaerophilales bacterium]